MKNILTIATAVIALAWGTASQASIMVAVDTATELSGSWFFEDGQSDAVSVSNFIDLMPGGFPELQGSRSAFNAVVFGTNGIGSPDDPFFDETPGPFLVEYPDFSGSYDNTNSQTQVYFRYTNIQDTGEDDGAFSGDFCFSTDQADLRRCGTPPPVPAPAVPALIGLGLVLLRLSRRSSAA